MVRTGAYANLAAFFAVSAFAISIAAGAWAGSGSFEGAGDHDRDMIHFFGYTRGENGKPVPAVNINITTAKGEVSEMSDANGLFFFDSRGKTFDPSAIAFSCAKEGYKDATGSTERYSGDDAPVLVTCLMRRSK